MKSKVLLTLFVLISCVFQLTSLPAVLAAPYDPAAPGDQQPVHLALPLIFSSSETEQSKNEPPPATATATPPPVKATTTPDPTGMIDIWVFVDNDGNGVYSSGDLGLSEALACLTFESDDPNCVGTDEGDTRWEDLPAGQYWGAVDPDSLPAGYVLQSIRCEETDSRAEYSGCHYDLDAWMTRIEIGPATRLNIFFALAYITPPKNGYVDLWAIVDADQNEIFSAGDIGLTGARVCLTYNGGSPWCGGTDVGDTWWEDLPPGNYEAYLDPISMPSGMWLRSIHCAETSSSQGVFSGCTNDLANWKTTFTLGPATRINVYFGLQYNGPPNNGFVDIWVFVDNDQNGVYSSGDQGLPDVLACLDPPSGGDPSCFGTDDEGDTWWEDRYPAHYQAWVDSGSVPADYSLRSIRCQKIMPYAGVFLGCSTDVANWSTGFTLGATDHINVFFALELVE
jgi:hypothetical protein